MIRDAASFENTNTDQGISKRTSSLSLFSRGKIPLTTAMAKENESRLGLAIALWIINLCRERLPSQRLSHNLSPFEDLSPILNQLAVEGIRFEEREH